MECIVEASIPSLCLYLFHYFTMPPSPSLPLPSSLRLPRLPTPSLCLSLHMNMCVFVYVYGCFCMSVYNDACISSWSRIPIRSTLYTTSQCTSYSVRPIAHRHQLHRMFPDINFLLTTSVTYTFMNIKSQENLSLQWYYMRTMMSQITSISTLVQQFRIRREKSAPL